MKHHICIFTGARPNFIKVAPIMRVMEQNSICDFRLVYAGTDWEKTGFEKLLQLEAKTQAWLDEKIGSFAELPLSPRNVACVWLIWWLVRAPSTSPCRKKSTVW